MSRSRAISPNSSPSPATIDWTSALAQGLGYLIAALLFVAPILLVWWVMGTRGFARGKRIRWASREMPPIWWRTTMDQLPPPFNEDPEERPRDQRK